MRLDQQNLGKTKTNGLDFTFDWQIGDTRFGEFAFGYRSTFVFEYEFQREPGGEFFSRAGIVVDGFPVVEYSHYATLTWNRDRFLAQVQNRFLDGFEDCNERCQIAPEFFNEVDSYSLWHLVATYQLSDALAVTARITNLFDEDPPFTNSQFNGFERNLHTPVGRAFGLTITGHLEDLFRSP